MVSIIVQLQFGISFDKNTSYIAYSIAVAFAFALAFNQLKIAHFQQHQQRQLLFGIMSNNNYCYCYLIRLERYAYGIRYIQYTYVYGAHIYTIYIHTCM